jgi:hypothetical protein
MKARGKKVKRKRGPSLSFGELVRKLWQPEPEGLEAKVAAGSRESPVGKGKRVRKS